MVDNSIDFAIKYYAEWLREKQGSNIVRAMQKSTNTLRIRLTAISLALSGIFFILYPAIRLSPTNHPCRGLRHFLPSRGFWEAR